MTDDHSEFWGVGRTHYEWEPDVRAVVQHTLSSLSGLSANTYANHPYPGWDGRSVDFWATGGRGRPLSVDLSRTTARFLFNLPGQPLIRHLIVGHRWWLRDVGWREWTRDDHSGLLRHVHVTYLPVPPLPWTH
jgi:hypothetical protein